MDPITALIIVLVAAVVGYAGKRWYNHQIAEAFSVGIDFGKAIAALTKAQIDEISA